MKYYRHEGDSLMSIKKSSLGKNGRYQIGGKTINDIQLGSYSTPNLFMPLKMPFF